MLESIATAAEYGLFGAVTVTTFAACIIVLLPIVGLISGCIGAMFRAGKVEADEP